MKNCNEMVSSLLERREQYEAEQKRKRKLIMTTAIPLGCLCFIAVLGVGVWQSGILGTSDIPQDKNDSVIAGGEGDRNDAFCGDYWVVGDGNNSGGEDNFATSTAPEDEPEESGNRYEKYDFSAYSEEIRYNPNPDNSAKIVGTVNSDYTSVKNLADVISEAYSVVVVKAIEDEEPIIHQIVNEEQAQIMIEHGESVPVSVVEVSKAEVLYSVVGEHNIGDEISVSKYVEGVGVRMEEGKEYLIITFEYKENGKTYYRPIVGQIGIFNINDDFTITSQSSAYVSAKYDGLSLADVAHDLKTKFDNAKAE